MQNGSMLGLRWFSIACWTYLALIVPTWANLDILGPTWTHNILVDFVKDMHEGPLFVLKGALALGLTHTVNHHRNHLCQPLAEVILPWTKMTGDWPEIGTV